MGVQDFRNNTNPSVTIRYIVASIKNDLREYTSRNDMYLMQQAIEGLIDLNLYDLENIEVAYLTMNEANEADLPADFIDYTKIGINIGGEMWTLSANENLILNRKVECSNTIREIRNNIGRDTVGSGYTFSDHYHNGHYIGALYGSGGGFNVSNYRIDKARRKILFGSDIKRTDEIIMEYKSTGINTSGTMVPRQAVQPIKSWVHWKRIEFDKNAGLGEKERKMNQYLGEVEKMRAFESIPTMDEYRDALYESLGQAPKR